MKNNVRQRVFINMVLGSIGRHDCWKLHHPTRFKRLRLNYKRNVPKLGTLVRAFGTANIDCAMMVPATEMIEWPSVNDKEVSHNG